MKFKSVSTALILSSTLAVVLAVGAILVYVTSTSRDMAQALYEQSMDQTATSVRRQVDDFVERSQSLLATLSGAPWVLEALTGDPATARARLVKYTKANEASIWSIFIADANGRILAGCNAGGEDLAGQDRASRDYFKALAGGQDMVFSPEVYSATSGGGKQYIYTLGKAIRDGQGKFLGMIGVFPTMRGLNADIIAPPRFGQRGYGYLLDTKGRIIGHAMDQGLLLKDLTTETFAKDIVRQGSGKLFYDWKGERKFVTFARCERTGWIVCMSAYVSEMQETAARQRTWLLALGGGAVLALGLVISILVRTLVSRPLAAIQAFTGHIVRGDFKTPLAGRFRFELEHLTRDIRAMVEELKNRLGFAQGLLDGMTVPCIVAGPDGRIRFANQAVLDVLDQPGTPESHKGQSVAEFFYGDPNRQTITGRVLAEKKPIRNVQTEMRTHKGIMRFVQVDAAPMYDLDGNLIAGFGLFMDLTEMRDQQRAIQAKNEIIARAAAQAQSVSDQVASAAEELSAQVEQSSRGSQEQQARTGETATAMTEMNATVMEVAKSAGQATDTVEKARAKAQEGERTVEEVVRAIGTINEKAETLKDDMTELGRKADGIGQILGVIADIADQTNLLALNAAIEAARAGDAGRGFAVVADEVRKLAEKTMSATNEVGASIKAMQESARTNISATEDTTRAILSSTDMAHRSGQALREIVGLVEETTDQMRGIAAASEQQSAAAEEISRSTGDINRLAGENAQAMEQSSRAVIELSRLAQDLRRIIGEMQG